MIVILLMFVVFIVTLLLGVPIYAAIGTATLIPLLVQANSSITLLPQTLFSGIDNFVLIAVALFIVSGSMMQASGLTDEILEAADSIVGHIPGGVGASTIIASGFFAALTGSGLAATVAIGSITVGGMVQRGYQKGLAGAVAASGGALGVLIPPSNPMIIYGVISGTSIGALFIAGLFPGILITASLALVMYFIGKKKKLIDPEKKFSWKRARKATWDGKWSLIAPFIILGSIYTGFATPTEAAEIAVFYAIFYGFVIKRNINVQTFGKAIRNGALTASIMLVMSGVANGFGRVVTMFQVPQKVGYFIANITTDPQLVLLMIVGLLFITGMFMETLSQIIILTPIFMPMLHKLGINPVVFGILFVLCIEIGFLTPPIGGNLFVAVKISDASLMEVSKQEIPFILTFLFWAILIVFFPEIVTFFPSLLGGFNH